MCVSIHTSCGRIHASMPLTYGVFMYTYLSSATYAKQDVSKYVYSWCVRHIKIHCLIYYLRFIHLRHAVYVQREDEYSMSVYVYSWQISAVHAYTELAHSQLMFTYVWCISQVYMCLKTNPIDLQSSMPKYTHDMQQLCEVRCSVLQCVAVCYSALPCVAVCCSVLQCVAVWCSVLQCFAVCRSVLRCTKYTCIYICWATGRSLD